MALVELRGGLVLPDDVIAFALALEDRGIVLSAGDEGTLKVKDPTGKPDLSDAEVAFIRSRKAHLLAVAAYVAPTAPPL